MRGLWFWSKPRSTMSLCKRLSHVISDFVDFIFWKTTTNFARIHLVNCSTATRERMEIWDLYNYLAVHFYRLECFIIVKYVLYFLVSSKPLVFAALSSSCHEHFTVVEKKWFVQQGLVISQNKREISCHDRAVYLWLCRIYISRTLSFLILPFLYFIDVKCSFSILGFRIFLESNCRPIR